MLFRFFPVSFPNVLILAGPFWRGKLLGFGGKIVRLRFLRIGGSGGLAARFRQGRCFQEGGSGVTAFSGAEPVESERVCVAAGAGGKSGGGLSWASLEGGISFAVSWSFSATVWFQVSLGFPALGGITAGTVRSFPLRQIPLTTVPSERLRVPSPCCRSSNHPPT